MKNMWPRVADDDAIKVYFPDFAPGELPNREYFWRVLATVRPDYFQNVVQFAITQRSLSVDATATKLETISIKEQWLEKLKEMQLLGCKSAPLNLA